MLPSPMRHALYEDPRTHKFALIRLPSIFVEGDELPIPPTARWFRTRAEALATISDLFDQKEGDQVDDYLH